MPYSLPVHSQGRVGHRRSYSATGAFVSLGELPRRVVPPKFHFRQDDDEDDSSEEDARKIPGLPPLRLKIKQQNFDAVPFPPLLSPPIRLPPSPSPPPRTSSTPTVLLSNGKPLKSSLKSSSSSPNIPFPSQSLVPSIMFPDLHPHHHHHQQQHHQRSSSAPCTPLLDVTFPPPSPLSSESSSTSRSPSPSVHHTPKNVHFPSQEEGGLATIRVFNRTARPASLSRLGEETETETDGEGSGNNNGGWVAWSGKYVGGSTYPFPRVPLLPTAENSPLNPSLQQKYEIDWSQSSSIPRKSVNRSTENIFFETLQLFSGPETLLQGTVLVRNIAYQKTVMVRYTLDEWDTVNDVLGSYDSNEPQKGSSWDRFKFSFSLGTGDLQGKVLWFVGKYASGDVALTPETTEWWDNNQGNNYKVGFRKEKPYKKRGVAFSAPPIYSPQQQEQHQAALTQCTLARLKKLNLKNYAAPRGSSSTPVPRVDQTTPPVLTLTSASPITSSFVVPSPPPDLSLNTVSSSPTLSNTSTDTTTSTDSTPVQTPTQGDDDDDDDEKKDEQLRWSLSMENGHFTTSSPLLPSTPIPISTPRRTFTYGGMGTSPPFSDLEESVIGGGTMKKGVYWDWGSASAAILGGSDNGGGLTPPQRKRHHQRSSSSDSSSTKQSTSSPTKQKPTPPKINLPPRTLTSPPPMTAGVQSPYSGPPTRRGLGYRHFPSKFSSPPSPPTTPSASNDAIYQALVREWCFAQGPGPIVGGISAASLNSSSSSSSSNSSEISPLEVRR